MVGRDTPNRSKLLAESLKEGGGGRVAIAVVESDDLLFEIAQHGMRQVGDTFTLRGGGT